MKRVEESEHFLGRALFALRGERPANNLFVVRDGKDGMKFPLSRGTFAKRRLTYRTKLVLLDLKLPKTTDLKVLSDLKSDSRTRSVPLVILTFCGEERGSVNGLSSSVLQAVDFDQIRKTVNTLGSDWLGVTRSSGDASRFGASEVSL
jgi:two-component system, response regulator